MSLKHTVLIGLILLFSFPVLATLPSTNNEYASYIILGQSPNGNNVAIARTVIETNYSCPTVIPIASANSEDAIAMVSRDNPNHFSVVVCEALVNFDTQYQIQYANKSIPLPIVKSKPENIQVFGDTGCKPKEKGKKEAVLKGLPPCHSKAWLTMARRIIPI